jgi:hypothetical protein
MMTQYTSGLIVFLIVLALFIYLSKDFILLKRALFNNTFKMVVVAMFKNEEMIIREWVEHYKWQGVDHILLLDNNSTDDYKSKLVGFESFITVLPAPKLHAQLEQYNTIALPWLREYGADIVVVVDLDEYLFGKDRRTLREHIPDLFSGINYPSQILVPWTMFGSSDHQKQPESIRKSFVQKQSLPVFLKTKAILLLKDIDHIGIHFSWIRGWADSGMGQLQLNHYSIMSKEYYAKVKMTRGDVASSKYESIRDWAYFDKYDFKDEKDTLLKDILEAYESNLSRV